MRRVSPYLEQNYIDHYLRVEIESGFASMRSLQNFERHRTDLTETGRPR